MIAQSQSGTGKTAAFSLTMLSRIAYGQELPQVSRFLKHLPSRLAYDEGPNRQSV
jgi:superfamily II DNA/RNA helicase